METNMSLISSLVIISLICATAQHKHEGTTPAFTPEERFLDIFPLTKDNFTSTVLKKKDPWIIIFHDGTLTMEWKKVAVSVRGVVWMGMVDKTNDPDLVKDMGYDPIKDPVARVYPYGGLQTKKNKWKAVRNPNDAKQMAVNSVPDQTLRLKGKDMKDFLIECFTASPTKFPLILLTDDREASPLFKAISERFQRYFHFGRFVNPTVEDYRAMGISLDYDTFDMPAILVLVPQNPGMVESFSFNAVEYRIKTMGMMNYPNVLQFLFAVNNQYRHWLPGDNMSNIKEMSEMEDIIEIESNRFQVLFDGKVAKITKNVEEEKEDTSIKFKKVETKQFSDLEQSTKDEL